MILAGGTGGSALCKTGGTHGIGKGGGGISGAHNEPKELFKINPDPRSPLICTIGSFLEKRIAIPQLI